MNRIKILVVDDEALIAEFIKKTLIEIGFTNVLLAYDSKQAIQIIEEFKPKLILLDIRMEFELEGIKLGEKINEIYKIPFIYITSHSDKEIIEKALNTNPYGYITKPVKKPDVFASINLAFKRIEEREKQCLIFKDGYDTVRLFFDDILYAESARNYIYIYTHKKKYSVRNSLEWFVESVPKEYFAKVHRSFVVNTKKISKRTSNSVFVENIEIPASRRLQINLS